MYSSYVFHFSSHVHSCIDSLSIYGNKSSPQKKEIKKGVQPNGSTCANNHCTLDMSKAFNTINIHSLIIKLQHTNILGTIIKFIENYIKGRKAYTTYTNYTSRQRQFKTGIPQGGFLSPTLFNIYTLDLPPPSTGSCHGLRRRHHHHIHIHKHECSQEIHTTIPT